MDLPSLVAVAYTINQSLDLDLGPASRERDVLALALTSTDAYLDPTINADDVQRVDLRSIQLHPRLLDHRSLSSAHYWLFLNCYAPYLVPKLSSPLHTKVLSQAKESLQTLESECPPGSSIYLTLGLNPEVRKPSHLQFPLNLGPTHAGTRFLTITVQITPGRSNGGSQHCFRSSSTNMIGICHSVRGCRDGAGAGSGGGGDSETIRLEETANGTVVEDDRDNLEASRWYHFSRL